MPQQASDSVEGNYGIIFTMESHISAYRSEGSEQIGMGKTKLSGAIGTFKYSSEVDLLGIYVEIGSQFCEQGQNFIHHFGLGPVFLLTSVKGGGFAALAAGLLGWSAYAMVIPIPKPLHRKPLHY